MKILKLILRTILSAFLILALCTTIKCILGINASDSDLGNALGLIAMIITLLMPILIADAVALIIIAISLIRHIKGFLRGQVKLYEVIWLALMQTISISIIVMIALTLLIGSL